MNNQTMNAIRISILSLLLITFCGKASSQEKIILLNEGNWQADNAKVTYFEDGRIVSNQWFRDVNGYKIGDTPNDIIQVSNDLIAIAVNWSNIIQFINPEGRAVAAIEDIPNNRYMASDGVFVYVTSYAHECSVNGTMKTFDKGFVAKIDTRTFTTVAATEVGYEPDGIALYGGHLFVANSGGYSFTEDHDYEQSVSVLDAETMNIVRTIETGSINLYGHIARSGKYLLINSAGDFYEATASSLILDCEKAIAGEDCVRHLDFPATYSTTDLQGNFLVIGSAYSYLTGGYELDCHTVEPAIAYAGNGGISAMLPGTMKSDVEQMTSPYAIYVNPYTGYIYAADASSYADGGKMYQWSADGKLLGTHKVYINPGHFLALPPNGIFDAIETFEADEPSTSSLYDLQGRRVYAPKAGTIYISNGRKVVY